MYQWVVKAAPSFFLTALLAGCGGGGGSGAQQNGTNSPNVVSASFEGIWSGEIVSSVTGNRIKVNGIARPSGELMFFAIQDCHVFNGSYSIAGTSLSTLATAQWRDYCFGDEAIVPIGWNPNATVANTLYTQTMNGAGTVSTASNSSLAYTASAGDKGNITLSYWSIYDRPSSLSKLAGTYSNRPSLRVTINADGTFTGTEVASFGIGSGTRHYSGKFTVLNSAKNLYDLQLNMDGKDFHGYAFTSDSAAGKTDDAIQLVGIQASWGPFVHYWIRQ